MEKKIKKWIISFIMAFGMGYPIFSTEGNEQRILLQYDKNVVRIDCSTDSKTIDVIPLNNEDVVRYRNIQGGAPGIRIISDQQFFLPQKPQETIYDVMENIFNKSVNCRHIRGDTMNSFLSNKCWHYISGDYFVSANNQFYRSCILEFEGNSSLTLNPRHPNNLSANSMVSRVSLYSLGGINPSLHGDLSYEGLEFTINCLVQGAKVKLQANKGYRFDGAH